MRRCRSLHEGVACHLRCGLSLSQQFPLSLCVVVMPASETDMTVTDSTRKGESEGGASQIIHSIDVSAVD